jgi:hypothetical protein
MSGRLLKGPSSNPWVGQAMKSLLSSPGGSIAINPASKRDASIFALDDSEQMVLLSMLRLLEKAGAISLDGAFGKGMRMSLVDESILRETMGLHAQIPPVESLRDKLAERGVESALASCAASSCLSARAEPKDLAAALIKAQAGAEGFKGTLRQFSALHFFGDSKFLDTRDALRLYLCGHNFAGQPLTLNMWLPLSFQGFLWIENLDTFDYFCNVPHRSTQGLALVYGQGFKGASARVLDPRSLRLFFKGELNQSARAHELLLSQKASMAFFGDLDHAGMAILATLRKSFPSLTAWAPGYGGLLDMLSAGLGHKAEQARKENQTPVSSTGCLYADSMLLPALATGQMIDQEAFMFDNRDV